MRAVSRTIATGLLVLLVTPRPGRAQSPDADIVGIMRQDGIALPHFEWRGGTWVPVRTDSLPQVSSLFLRDSTGRSDRFPTLAKATVNDGYDYSGWQVEMSMPGDLVLQRYPSPRVGYVVARSAGDAPFRKRALGESDPLRTEILRSLRAAMDTVLTPIGVNAWEARLGARVVVFFEVGSGPGVVGCYGTLTSGWYRDDWDAPVVATHQQGDCEKGVQNRTPWALLERGGGIYGHITVHGWEGADYELWSVNRAASRVAVFSGL